MPFLPPRGLFLEVFRYSRDDVNVNPLKDEFDRYITYVSLTTKEITLRIDSPGYNTVNYGYSEQLLGNLSLDLNPFYSAKSSLTDKQPIFYFGNNGLILAVRIDGTYQVTNPATKQVLYLPKPPPNVNIFDEEARRWFFNKVIINLSCPLSSTNCCFFVARFLKPRKLVEIYYSKRQTWVQYGFHVEDRLINTIWYLSNYVFLHGTLYFVTHEGQVGALEFESLDDEPRICSSYAFALPEVVRDERWYVMARLGEAQGCLYLSYADMREVGRGLWIWKHDGASCVNPWILLFEISKTSRLCKPVANEHLVKLYDDGHSMFAICFHPEAAVVFIYVTPSLIFAYDLTNDTVDKIGVLDKGERVTIGFTHPYSPCLASLESFLR